MKNKKKKDVIDLKEAWEKLDKLCKDGNITEYISENILPRLHNPAFPDRESELEYIKFLEEQDKQWDGDK